MFRKLLATLLLACLVLPLVAAPQALAALDLYSCPTCGESFLTIGQYITHLKTHSIGSSYSSSSSSSFKISSCTTNADGTTTIKWTGGTAPYSVHYELSEQAPNSFWWTEVESTYSTHCTFKYLAPDVSYKLIVTDKNNNRAEYTYKDYSYTWNEIGSQLELYPRVKQYGSVESLSRFSSSAIERSGYGTSYGLYVKLSYSMLARPRHYNYRFVVAAPNDYCVVWSGTLDLPSGRSSLSPWNFLDLSEFFDGLEKWYGEVPVGYYDFRLYYDDVHVLTKTFYVGG